jgi:hypothetical protein
MPAPPSLRPPAGATAFASYNLGPGVDRLGLQFRQPGEPRTNFLDGPVDGVEAPDAVPIDLALVPVSDKRRAEMAARGARFGVAPEGAPAAPEPERRIVSASAEIASGRRVILDASEGTQIDPLRSKNWDLNASHAVPSFR